MFEMNFLVPHQKVPVSFSGKSGMSLENEIQVPNLADRYGIYRPILKSIEGMWYELRSIDEDDKWLLSSPFCDGGFEEDRVGISPFDSMEEMAYDNDHFVPLIIRDEFLEDFQEVTRLLLQHAPDQYILFSSYFEGARKDFFCGVLTSDAFFELIKNHQIAFNVCYIISDLNQTRILPSTPDGFSPLFPVW